MRKVQLIATLLLSASFDAAFAGEIAMAKKREVIQTVSFEEVQKNIGAEITFCKRLHGVMTRISSARMQGSKLEIKGEANPAPIDNYPMKAPATAEQLRSLAGKPICDPN